MNPLQLLVVWTALAGAASAQTFSRSFPLVTPNGNAIGLENNGDGDLLFTDLGAMDRLGLTDTNGVIGPTLDISANSQNPIGVTTNGTSAIWITDTAGPAVDRYDAFGNYISSFSVAGSVIVPEGITYSPLSGTLFVTDGITPRVVEFDVVGNALNSFPLNGGSVDGIAYDPTDNSFWVYDSGTDSLRNYGPSFVERSSIPGTIANGFAAGEGVAVIGDEIFVMSAATQDVVVFVEQRVRASTSSYGDGCPPSSDFYELFGVGNNDLSGSSFTIAPGPLGFTVTSAGSFDTNFSNNLSAGDDVVISGQLLGFTAAFPGLGVIDRIDIDSNGRIGVGLPFSDSTESVDDFLASRQVALCWDDLDPSAGGGVYFDTFPGFAMVTWDQVPQFFTADSNTFQVKLYDDGRIECNYVSVADDSIVGLSGGSLGIDNGSIDLTSAIPFVRLSSARPLTLSEISPPLIGTSFTMVTTDIPLSGVGGGVILGSSPISVSGPLLPTGCSVLSSGDITTLPIDLTTGLSSIALPLSPSLLGISVFAQSAVLDPSLSAPVPVILSNGLQIVFGEI